MTEAVAMKIQNLTKTKFIQNLFQVQVAVITLLGNTALLPCRVMRDVAYNPF